MLARIEIVIDTLMIFTNKVNSYCLSYFVADLNSLRCLGAKEAFADMFSFYLVCWHNYWRITLFYLIQCWENLVGTELYRLILVDLVVITATILLYEFPRGSVKSSKNGLRFSFICVAFFSYRMSSTISHFLYEGALH